MAKLSESDFLDKIGEEYSWRRREIILYKSKVPTEMSDIQTVMLRASIPFIYAHWEGYVKVCMSLYLKYVSELHLTHDQLKSTFVALSLSNSISPYDNGSLSKKVEIVDLLFKNMTSRSNIPKKNVINTRSNLRYEVFKEIMFHVDLNEHGLNLKEDLIDSLVDTRNHIAHGEYKYVSYETFLSFHEEVLSLLERVKTLIENSTITKNYLK